MPGGGGSTYFGVLAATGGNDTLAASGIETVAGSFSLLESGDTFAGLGADVIGTIGISEGADSAALSGTCIVASMAVTEGHDSFVGSGAFLASGSISVTAGNDSLAASGLFSASGSISLTGGNDSPSIAGLLTTTGSYSGSEGHDALAASGVFTSPASMSPTEGHDALSGAGAFATAATISATDGDDTAVILAACGSQGIISTAEGADAFAGTADFGSAAIIAGGGPDVLAGSGSFATSASMGVTEGGDEFAGLSSGLLYNIYSNTGAGDPINYVTPIATTGLLTWTSSPLSFPGTWSFGVRASNEWGTESNVDCAVTIVLSASGVDITNMPMAPIALRAFATAGGGIRVEWAQPPSSAAKAPTGFHVYYGIGSVDYGVVRATVLSNSGLAGSFVANIPSLINGTTYLVSVRAYNATAEEANTNIVQVVADSSGPSAVQNLTCSAV